MSIRQRHLLWTVMALLGIATTAALTWSITRVAGQRIALSSEPLSVMRGLAPGAARRAAHQDDQATRGHGGDPPAGRRHGTRLASAARPRGASTIAAAISSVGTGTSTSTGAGPQVSASSPPSAPTSATSRPASANPPATASTTSTAAGGSAGARQSRTEPGDDSGGGGASRGPDD